jgi:hypothetical protein
MSVAARVGPAGYSARGIIEVRGTFSAVVNLSMFKSKMFHKTRSTSPSRSWGDPDPGAGPPEVSSEPRRHVVYRPLQRFDASVRTARFFKFVCLLRKFNFRAVSSMSTWTPS